MTSRATNLHSSRLIRALADLVILDSRGPDINFAEVLGLWLDHHDAIALRAVHTKRVPIKLSGVKSVASVDLNDEFTRMRTSLVNLMTTTAATNLGSAAVELPSPAYEPYRRYYLEHQRNMALSVRALRVHVREVLTSASPELNQLAALDAVLDEILCDRESKLLSTVPLLLARRFEQSRKAHQQMLDATQQADNPSTCMQAQGWLARFCNELQTVLLAELDVRLQPTLGLIEAFNNKITPH
jgi:hypothetical protein